MITSYLFIPVLITLALFQIIRVFQGKRLTSYCSVLNVSWLGVCTACFLLYKCNPQEFFFLLFLHVSISFFDMLLFFFLTRCTFMVGVYMQFPCHITQGKYLLFPCSLQLLKKLLPLFAIPTLTRVPHSLSKTLCPDV